MSPAEPHTAMKDEALNAVLRDYVEATRRLQGTHELLAQEVQRLRGELASKDRELERRRRLSALGELAAGVAHEVRNPLGAIQLYSGLLRRKCKDTAAVLELVSKIEAGVRAIDGVVQDTLALAPRSAQLGVAGLRSVVESACELCCEKLHRLQVRVALIGTEAELAVRAEPDGLRRVLINLIVNAAEASTAGAVVEVVTETDEDSVVVTVRDRGSGLTDEALDKLFDPFFTTKDHGTGLGLTIAHRVVEAYGGRLSGANRPDGGAEFRVRLMRAADHFHQGVQAPARTDRVA